MKILLKKALYEAIMLLFLTIFSLAFGLVWGFSMEFVPEHSRNVVIGATIMAIGLIILKVNTPKYEDLQ